MGIDRELLESQLIGQKIMVLASVDKGLRQCVELDIHIQLSGEQVRIQVANVKLSFPVPLMQATDVVEEASDEKSG